MASPQSSNSAARYSSTTTCWPALQRWKPLQPGSFSAKGFQFRHLGGFVWMSDEACVRSTAPESADEPMLPRGAPMGEGVAHRQFAANAEKESLSLPMPHRRDPPAPLAPLESNGEWAPGADEDCESGCPPIAEMYGTSSGSRSRLNTGMSVYGIDIPEEIQKSADNAPEGSPLPTRKPNDDCGTPFSKRSFPLSPSSKRSKGSTSRRSMRTFSFRRRKTSSIKPNFNGQWTCTATWGLDAFLKDAGVSKMQRMAAQGAPWPSWEFDQNGDAITFTNHSFLGDLIESFRAGGPEYKQVDGRKQELTCKSYWEDETLIIERSGPQGRFREERSIDAEGMLQFTLKGLDNCSNSSWGRTFKRAG